LTITRLAKNAVFLKKEGVLLLNIFLSSLSFPNKTNGFPVWFLTTGITTPYRHSSLSFVASYNKNDGFTYTPKGR
jgi:hypothetical protein